MKAKHYLPIITMVMTTLTGCNQKAPLTSGLDLANMDTTALPGTDFYQYACGGWMKNHPLTDEYSRFYTLDQMSQNNIERLNNLITGIAAEEQEAGTLEQKIGDLYNIVMDSVQLNRQGINPVRTDITNIRTIKERNQLLPYIDLMMIKGVENYFETYIGADMIDSKTNIVSLCQGGFALGEREYYLDNDEATKDIREKYKQHVQKMFQLFGLDEYNAKWSMECVMEIETRLAKAALSRVELRNPANSYHKMTIDELKKEIPNFNWDAHFTALGFEGIKEVDLSHPAAIKEAVNIINTVDLDKQKAYLIWNLIHSASPYLSDEIYEEYFDFYGRTMTGRQEPSPRWKRAVSTVNGFLGEAVGQMYVKQYFPPEAKERMITLVKNLQTALRERIQAQTWMSDTTKAKAIEKLDAFYIKIGYPDKWTDYTDLIIDPEANYWVTAQRACAFRWNKLVSDRFNKPVDRDEWHMTPQTVNAYYNPSTNEICFPAGILQYPCFDMSADDAFNYGAIGVVIGHEMTHGFDDQGRKFDLNGNFVEWWTPADAERFQERAQVLVNFFDSINVLPDLKANGQMTLGENLADHGGLKIAFNAFKNATENAPLETVDGFTPEQRFFLAYSLIWAGNIRNEDIRNLTKSDVHSLGRWRVNGTLPHIDEWYDAFGITEEDPMFIPKEERIDIW